jgi:hypothetical protein
MAKLASMALAAILTLIVGGSAFAAPPQPSVDRSATTRAVAATLRTTTAQPAQIAPQAPFRGPRTEMMAAADPCEGASSSPPQALINPQTAKNPTFAARINPAILELNPFGSAGSGPIPDVTTWLPTTRAAAGSELVVQGRNLIPNNLLAVIGATQLTATSQQSTRFISRSRRHCAVPAPRWRSITLAARCARSIRRTWYLIRWSRLPELCRQSSAKATPLPFAATRCHNSCWIRQHRRSDGKRGR